MTGISLQSKQDGVDRRHLPEKASTDFTNYLPEQLK